MYNARFLYECNNVSCTELEEDKIFQCKILDKQGAGVRIGLVRLRDNQAYSSEQLKAFYEF